MSTSSRVVSLEVPKNANPARRSIPPVLHSVRQQAKQSLNELLQGMFDGADDALFEMADRSRNDAEHQMYFESMRSIRLERKSISKKFVAAFHRGFDVIFEAEPESSTQIAGDEPDLDSMSLVQNDELEVSVAMAGIVSKVTSHYSLPIMQLTKRVDHVCDVRTIGERMNPLGPYQLTSAFVQSIDDLDVDIKVRIIILKLFERYVVGRLADFYKDANRQMIEAGVLPELRDVAGRDSSHRQRSTGETRSTGPGATAPRFTSTPTCEFTELQSLLAAVRPAGPAAGIPTGQPVSTDELMDVIGTLENGNVGPIALDQAPAAVDYRQMLNARMQAPMGQADEDAVNLIGMLFDYILNDRNLAVPMKALIARLQLPMLKIAIRDKSFFSKTGHPARQLLNELSSAGIGWSRGAELKRDTLYNLIESIVLRVVNDFEEGSTLLEDLVGELRRFMTKDARKRDLIETRVKQTEAGKAKTDAARQSVQALVNEKACGLRLPPIVGRFVSETWTRVLVYACVKWGERSREWSDAVATLDTLLWSVQPMSEREDIERRERIAPEILDRLHEGMAVVKVATAETESTLEAVENLLADLSANDRAYLEEDEVPMLVVEYDELEEIVLSTAEAPESLPVTPDPEHVTAIERLSEGAWVEMNADSDEVLRCKLATVVTPGEKYIFVNRRGMKVAERTKMGLAADLKRDALTLLEESQVFDRALQTVIGNLRNMQARA